MARIIPNPAILACSLLLALAAQAAPTAEPGPAATWQPRKLEFTYMGITARYSCDGIEQKVRDILVTLGARKDVHVRASGCDMGAGSGLGRISRTAMVEAEFNALVPEASGATPAAAAHVRTAWVPVELRADRPRFLGAGDCELIEQLRDVLLKDFTLRNTEYRAACFPHQVSTGSYAVKTEALQAVVP